MGVRLYICARGDSTQCAVLAWDRVLDLVGRALGFYDASSVATSVVLFIWYSCG